MQQPPSGVRRLLSAPLLREPLVQFLLGGAAIFALTAFLPGDGTATPVLVDARLREQLATRWQTQLGRPPAPAELLGILDNHITEELYYREALALGLDRQDLIVRRRLVQKLRFLTEDLATLTPATPEELRAFHAERAETWRIPARFSFEHRLFVDTAGQSAAAAAGAALALLAAGREAGGHSSLLPAAVTARPLTRVRNLFGEEFAGRLASLTPGDAWQGPLASAYGLHLVRLFRVLPAETPPYEAVAEKVRSELDRHRRRQAHEALLAELRLRYRVEWR